ncbi:hypothetical protein SCUCBS95973_007837 [Sporothrix curviconia]|uniref:Peptide hydrolase n=1 Tax=Sporothrix curviconia TaxID=1260050 RepID=A0ABP0CGM4_9PEZI
MPSSIRNSLLLALGASRLGVFAHDPQVVLAPPAVGAPVAGDDLSSSAVDEDFSEGLLSSLPSAEDVLKAVAAHDDPVAALVAVRPDLAAELAEPRLLHVFGEAAPEWMTEGDKARLHRHGKKFMDVTDHWEFYAEQQERHQDVSAQSGKANLPGLVHQRLVKPLFNHISTQRMRGVLKHMTSYYTRYFGSTTGEKSAQWLHDHIAEPSIIARFEPKVRNASLPLTILGAHQDSMNYLFPLLPAPGADDDCSGTVSILEAFHILAEHGYTPKNGPVEFHWYAAEEGGLLGSQPIARYKKEQGARIGAMMEFDMTAFIARNATESIGLIKTKADEALTNWTQDLAKEYISIPVEVYDLGAGAGSDYMSFTKLDYPAAFASEGNPMKGGFPGEFDPYVHGIHDTMDVDDENGVFSLEHMARFSELAIAFVIEQAGWDNAWR